MTIQLKDARYVNGALQAAGAVVTTNAQLERELVSANLAVYTVAPVVEYGQNITDIVRNAAGKIESYKAGGITKTVTFNPDGTFNTLTGGGETLTATYSGGKLSGVIYT